MKHRSPHSFNKAFSITELIIVIAIILILATAALNTVPGVLQGLRFNNAFNKMVLMVQEARSLAMTAKKSADFYEVHFPTTGSSQKAYLKSSDEELDTLILEAKTNLKFFFEPDNCAEAIIQFATVNGKLTITCTGAANPNPQILTVGLKEIVSDKTTRSRSFSIHSASGIPQVK